MIIKFLENYSGRETAMQERGKGTVLDMPVEYALELIRLGVAEEVIEKPKRKEIKEFDK